jgi:hypothetical protein
MLEPIPTQVDLAQDWLVNYWAGQLGVSPGRLAQAVGVVGPDTSKLKRHLKEGHRVAIRDDTGVVRLVMRVLLEQGGFAASVPYHPAKQGWVFEQPLHYDKTEYVVPVSQMKNYTVEDGVKLSMHMGGFVQFSTSGGKPIVSGYNRELGQIKGAGVRAPQPVHVTTGPLFGVIFQGLDRFDPQRDQPAEIFEEDDLWHHPSFSTPADTAYNLEVFMFPTSLLGAAQLANGKRTLKRSLPFKSKIKFDFELRVIELPQQPFFLGLILSHIRPDGRIESGYKINGPGCGGPGEQKRCIGAWYPRPDFVNGMNPTSLDYHPAEQANG